MLLSIIIPVYNTPIKYIKECIESLIHITLPKDEYEVIMIDDGSTEKKVLHYIESINTESFTLFKKKNGGLSSARNYGISKSKGMYIYPLDSDDKICDEYSFFIDVLKEEKVELLYGNYYVFGTDNFKVVCPKFSRLRQLYDQNLLPACSFYKKEVWKKIGGYDESFKTIEDWDFWARCVIANVNFTQIDKCAYHYRVVLDGKSMIQTTMNLKESFLEKIRNKIPPLQLSKKELDSFVWEYATGFENKTAFNKIVNRYLEERLFDRDLQKKLLKLRVKYYKKKWYKLIYLFIGLFLPNK